MVYIYMMFFAYVGSYYHGTAHHYVRVLHLSMFSSDVLRAVPVVACNTEKLDQTCTSSSTRKILFPPNRFVTDYITGTEFITHSRDGHWIKETLFTAVFGNPAVVCNSSVFKKQTRFFYSFLIFVDLRAMTFTHLLI